MNSAAINYASSTLAASVSRIRFAGIRDNNDASLNARLKARLGRRPVVNVNLVLSHGSTLSVPNRRCLASYRKAFRCVITSERRLMPLRGGDFGFFVLVAFTIYLRISSAWRVTPNYYFLLILFIHFLNFSCHLITRATGSESLITPRSEAKGDS